MGLAPRILLAGGLVLVFLVVEFGLVAHSFHTVRSATAAEERSQRAVLASVRLEKLVLDIETGTRGFVITQDDRFLEPFESGIAALPAQVRELERTDPGPETAQIVAATRRYVSQWARPQVELARRDAATARARTAAGGGKRRVDAIRHLIDPYVARSVEASAADRERVQDAQRSGIVVGATGIVVTLLLFAAAVGYFLRAAVSPLRRIAVATQRVAGGERGIEVAEEGAGEVGRLASSFNQMSRSLAHHERELGEQNDDLERLANVLRAVLDSTVDGILLSDAEGNVQLANRPLLTLTRDLGMSFEGTVVDRLLSVADRMADPDEYRAAMQRLRTSRDESTFDEFEDVESGRVFQGFTAPVRDDRGGFLGRVWTLREVTQQRELDRLKDDFVATVSHELRTPLTSMMGFLEMIREGEAGELNDEQTRFLSIVYRSSERLQRLVGDLLFVARLDANGLQLQFSDVDVQAVASDVVESTSALARARSLELVTELDAVPPVTGDRERILQLVTNLVSNAIKFTPAGGTITVRTAIEDDHVVVEVEDNGIGIPVAEQARLFQRFFRSSTATEQAIPGTGLGLVISKAIAEAHGGSISVRSRPGEGTCFHVELPLSPAEVAV